MAVERWTDEMLDSLASSVGDLRETVSDLRESVADIRETVNSLGATSQVLLQVAAQNQRHIEKLEEDMELDRQEWKEEQKLWKQKQAENDERFNVLLEEVRFLIRNQNQNPEQQ